MHAILAVFLLLLVDVPALILLAPTPVSAQAGLGTRAALPAPVKPSDVVVLTNSSLTPQPCGDGLDGLRLDLQILSPPDNALFSVPPGKVLVLSHFDYILIGGNAGDPVRLLVTSASGDHNADVFSFLQGGVGQASGAFDLGAVVVKAGLGLCVWKQGLFSGGKAHARGYLAADQ